MKRIFFLTIVMLCCVSFGGAFAQNADSLSNDADTLQAAVFVKRQATNFISKSKPIRTEVISAAGLCKMACCNLAESFENSASVTVGFSDAVTGARQIRLLGLSGVYTQMLDENRPVMRGLPAPFGLSYVPGQWLESIQIAKGPSSVTNGTEAITGQINMEHRKPTLEQPLFLNAAVMSDLKADFNIASSLQLNDKWSTVLLGHVSYSGMEMDHNHDGFMDDPKSLQLNFSNRWLYYAYSGVQVRFGFRALSDTRFGGEMGSPDYWKNPRPSRDDSETTEGDNRMKWGSGILNHGLNGYVKVGVPLNDENTRSIAFVGDYTYHNLDSYFGLRDYDGSQHSGFGNLLFQDEISSSHKYVLGLTGQYDGFRQNLTALRSDDIRNLDRREWSVGAFGEYTYHYDDKFTGILGLRGDWNNLHGFLFTPRLNLKYSFADDMVVARATAGRGYRSANPIVDNIGVLSTGREIVFEDGAENLIEKAWTFGGNMSVYFPIGDNTNNYFSVDYFATLFDSQLVVDQELSGSEIHFYPLEGKSYTHTYQADLSLEPFERFTVMATFRYTDSKQEYRGRGLVERPLVSRYKGVLNLQYATNLNKWIFDFTVSLNGPSKVYDFMLDEKDANGNLLYPNGESPVYPMLYAQITRKFKGWDIYLGGENLTNYRQNYAILDSANPFSEGFNASAVWGPLMGIKVYLGFRFTLWKY